MDLQLIRSRRALAESARRRLDSLVAIGCRESGLPLEKREAANVLARELRQELRQGLRQDLSRDLRIEASSDYDNTQCAAVVAAFVTRLKNRAPAR
jgi:hypothetical protein